MKGSLEALLEEFLKNNMIERLKNSQEDISVRNVLFWSSCLNMHPWQHLTTYFRKLKV